MTLRGKAITVFKHQGKFLFTVCIEKLKNEVFYIPVGGGIGFGELSLDAARRESMEEIGQKTKNEKLLEVSENIFTFNGIPEHEIVFIYLAEFLNEEAYTSTLDGGINSEGKKIELIWASLDEIRKNKVKIYPDSLLPVLEKIK